MQITKTIETPDGSVEFSGTLEGDELQVVIEVGLATLLRSGALPFLVQEEKDAAQVVFPLNETKQ